MTNVSYWVDSTLPTDDPRLTGDLSTSICVVGAGIVGVTTAWLLKTRGHDVVLIDMHRVAQGVTGYTTAKVTSSQGTIYSELKSKHNIDVARRFASSNEAAITWMRTLVKDHGIDCDWADRDNYVYATTKGGVHKVLKEIEAASEVGLKVHAESDVDLPFSVEVALRHEAQGQFHPRKYLLRLAQMFREAGGLIFEETRATGVSEKDGSCLIETQNGRIECGTAILATHYPITDRSLLFARVHPKRSYAITAPILGAAPGGMYISADQPNRSIRTIPDENGPLLLVGGEGHAVGQETDTKGCYDRLEAWMNEHFEVGPVSHRWSAQDGVTVDLLPYIGKAWRSADNVYLATGFRKWGMTLGTVAAHLLADQATGIDNDNASLFDPGRLTLKASAGRFAHENAKVGYHLVGDRIRHPDAGSFDDLGPGEAVVRGLGIDQVAAYRNEDGRLHKVSATCTHMGCIVRWNDAETSWDCPCHGSRFDPSGKVLEGPAVRDLPEVED